MAVPSVDPKLLIDLNEALGEYPPNELKLAKLERAGRALLKASGPEQIRGYLFLAGCAAVRGDSDSAKKFHQATLALAPGDAELWNNFLVSMIAVWDAPKALELAREIGQRFPGNAKTLIATKDSLIELGLLKSASEFCREHRIKANDSSWMDSIHEILEHYGITELDLSAAVKAARAVLREQGMPRPQFSCDALDSDTGAPGSIAFGFHPHGDVGSLTEVQKLLFSELARMELRAEESGAITFYLSPAWKGPEELVTNDGNDTR